VARKQTYLHFDQHGYATLSCCMSSESTLYYSSSAAPLLKALQHSNASSQYSYYVLLSMQCSVYTVSYTAAAAASTQQRLL
jgi:hypothetical protein